jgi:hypothetical protein
LQREAKRSAATTETFSSKVCNAQRLMKLNPPWLTGWKLIDGKLMKELDEALYRSALTPTEQRLILSPVIKGGF